MLPLGLVAASVAILLVSVAGGLATLRRHAIAASPTATSQCPDPYPANRDPSNPLLLPTPPGSNPLDGASFFVPGPAHGAAAGAIAQLLGLGTGGPGGDFADSESWADFNPQVDSSITRRPALAGKVGLLEKIADEPEAQRFSTFVQGGGPGAVYSQVQKIFCHNLAADPGTVPIINTYFMHPIFGGCPTRSQLTGPLAQKFRRQIDEMAAATGNRPAVYLIEIDAIGSSGCISKIGSMPLWEANLRYEIDKISALAHTVVYVEAGYSDANGPRYTARILNAIGVGKIRGFFTNDTHEAWTINEIHWGEQDLGHDPRRPLRRQHQRQRAGAEAQPSPHHAGHRGSLQSARPWARTQADHLDRLRPRRRVRVGAPARQQQRLWRRSAGRGVLAGPGGATLRQRERQARTGSPQQPVLRFRPSKGQRPAAACERTSGEGGIRTREGVLTPYSLSRRVPSATRPPLQGVGAV
jgi:hypothetical protein